jgi:hypothetical protein
MALWRSRCAIPDFKVGGIRRIGRAQPIQSVSQRLRTEPRTRRPLCDQAHTRSSRGIVTIVIHRRPCAWVTSCAALLVVNAVVLIRHDDDAGLAALVTLLRFHGIGADQEQIRHQCGGVAIGVPEMLRVARAFGLKARAYRSSWTRLAKTPLPGIAVLRDGTFLLLAKTARIRRSFKPRCRRGPP